MKEKLTKFLVRKPERNRKKRKTPPRWNNNITVDIKGREREVTDRNRLAQNTEHKLAITNTLINFRVYKSGKILEYLYEYSFLKQKPYAP
jgi:hypothetical protein